MFDDMIYAPFEGILPHKVFANLVVALPYDVLSFYEAKELAKDNPYSFLHISKAEIDFEDKIDIYDEKVYLKASENFRGLLTNAVLHNVGKPCFYVYKMQEKGKNAQIGIVVAASVKAYLEGRIKRHELTRIVKEDDRVKQIKEVGAQTGPALLINKNIDKVKEKLKNIVQKEALFEVEDVNKVKHSLWLVDDDEDIKFLAEEFNKQNKAYIADGHHRSAAAARIAKEENMVDEARFLAVAFFEDEMKILDYNRVVYDLNGLSKEEFLNKLNAYFKVVKKDFAKPCQKGEFAMYLDKEWYVLNYMGNVEGYDAVAKLDVSILSSKVLDEILGIKDLRNSLRIEFIGGIRGQKEIMEKTDRTGGVGFMLYPTKISELLEVADNDMLMPPKSTWFEPKLLDGMVSYPMSDKKRNLINDKKRNLKCA